MGKLWLFLLLSVPVSAVAQHFDAQKNWRRYRSEIFVAAGLGNYMGDLGGIDGRGVKVFLIDLEFSQFKNSYQVGYRYNLSSHTAMSHRFYYGQVSGSDELTGNPERANRNLSFQSNIYSYTANFEYYLIRSKPGHIYNIKGAKGLNPKPVSVYLFGGIGGFYFNPKAEYNGELVELQPLGTEGQGLPGGPDKYSRISVAIPTGLGVTYRLPFNFKLGVEFNYRFTFTDYLDDVSGYYYDNAKIEEANGEVAAALADRSPASTPPTFTQAGAIRGNPRNNDAFLSGLVTLTYYFKNKNKGPDRPSKHPFLRKD